MKTAIYNAKIIFPDKVLPKGMIIISGKKIEYAGPEKKIPGMKKINAKNNYIAPGLIDIHLHGAGLHSFTSNEPDTIPYIADFLLKNGVTVFLPTMICSEKVIKKISSEINQYKLKSRIPGIYVEGPYVNKIKRGGIPLKAIKAKINSKYINHLQSISNNQIKIMTFAPEIPGAKKLVNQLKGLKIIPAMGHSNCCLETLKKFSTIKGLHTTHLFNAMSSIDHKNPGLSLFSLLNDDMYTEINADGKHVHPEMLKLAYKVKNRDKLILIMDAVTSAGLKYGEYYHNFKKIISNKHGVFYKKEGTRVGSNILLNDGLRCFMECTGAPVHEAVKMATLNPARLLKIDRKKGSIQKGKDADLVFFNNNFTKVNKVFFEGE